jgi:hypothetical protein
VAILHRRPIDQCRDGASPASIHILLLDCAIWPGSRPALPLDEGRVDPLVGPRPYPILLQPNHSELVFLHDRDTFRAKVLPEVLDGPLRAAAIGQALAGACVQSC